LLGPGEKFDPMKTLLLVLGVICLPLMIGGFILGPTAFDLVFHRRPPERFLIPTGYSGWVRVNFRQKGAAPLPNEEGRLLLKVDAQGTLNTSSDPLIGHGKDDFYYYSDDPRSGEQRTRISNAGVCKGGMIWEISTLVDEPTSTPFEKFYVGSEDQYRRVADPENKLPSCE
jgi:hypothetical protein